MARFVRSGGRLVCCFEHSWARSLHHLMMLDTCGYQSGGSRYLWPPASGVWVVRVGGCLLAASQHAAMTHSPARGTGVLRLRSRKRPASGKAHLKSTPVTQLLVVSP
jgi:hypothetical protein